MIRRLTRVRMIRRARRERMETPERAQNPPMSFPISVLGFMS